MVSNYLNDKGVVYENVDVEKNPDLALKFDIGMSVPVTILVDGEGNEVKRSRGFRLNELEDIINSL
jgi:thioredoxin 1